MNSYSEYKESGIEWIGEIPLGWDVKKIKHGFYVKGRIGWKGLKSSEFLSEGFSYLVTGTDFKDGKIDWKGCYHIDKDRYEEDPYIQLHEDDLLITKDGSIGKLAVVDEFDKPACLNSGIFVVRSINGDFTTKYLYWVLMSNIFTQFNGYTSYGSTIQHLYQNIFVEFSFGFPTIEEQILISNYLDKKTSQIDSLIEKIQQKIELLKEQRTSLINQCVTKGLNPDVEMKDSGVGWIGDIPSHWMLLPIKFLVDTPVTDGPHETPEFIDDGVPFLSVESVVENKLVISRMRGYISKELHKEYSKKCKPRKNDIFLVKSGSTTGKSAIVETDKEFNVWSPLCLIRSNTKKIRPQFFFQSLQSDYFRKSVELAWSFGTQPNIGMNVIENLKIALPPLDEQVSIITELKPKLSIFDELVEKENERINLLKEYRQSLISNVVTGKVRITEEMI